MGSFPGSNLSILTNVTGLSLSFFIPILNSLTISSNLFSVLSDLEGEKISVLSYELSTTGSVISFSTIPAVAFIICPSSGSPESLYSSTVAMSDNPSDDVITPSLDLLAR